MKRFAIGGAVFFKVVCHIKSEKSIVFNSAKPSQACFKLQNKLSELKGPFVIIYYKI